MPPKAQLIPSTIASNSRSDPRPTLTHSKEWVVPPRPKPGRKAAQVGEEQTKKAINRASQKAFRERRVEYVQELEEKVRLLEQGEGEKSVFFQQQALRAKEESTQLRVENETLRHLVDSLRSEVDSYRPPSSSNLPFKNPKRHMNSSLDADSPSSKRPRRSTRASAHMPVSKSDQHASSSSSSSSSPSSSTSMSIHESQAKVHTNTSRSRPVFEGEYHESDPTCGLCTSETGCFCADNAAASPNEIAVKDLDEDEEEDPSCGLCSSETSCFCADVGYKIKRSSAKPLVQHPHPQLSAPPPPPPADFKRSTISVPLNLRKSSMAKSKVWDFHSSSSLQPTPPKQPSVQSTRPALCNGDPANCPACADDPFGKAFCNALSTSVCSTNPCSTCPTHIDAGPLLSSSLAPPKVSSTSESDLSIFEGLSDLPCCGDPKLCGSLSCGPPGGIKEEVIEEGFEVVLPRSVPVGVRTIETVPCNEAWKVLKCHPKIAFADLQMLADVVARRTHCSGSGPLSPTLSSTSLSPEFRTTSSIPISFLLNEGNNRRLTVERGAVDQAMALLDVDELAKRG